MKNKRNILIIILAFIVLISALWSEGIISKQIARFSAISYVKEHYPDKNLLLTGMEFSPAHGDYFVMFQDESGKTYGFQMLGRYFPIVVWNDPFLPKM